MKAASVFGARAATDAGAREEKEAELQNARQQKQALESEVQRLDEEAKRLRAEAQELKGKQVRTRRANLVWAECFGFALTLYLAGVCRQSRRFRPISVRQQTRGFCMYGTVSLQQRRLAVPGCPIFLQKC